MTGRGPFQWRRACAAEMRFVLHVRSVELDLEDTILTASNQPPDRVCQKRCLPITYINRRSVECGYSVLCIARIEKLNVEVTDVLLSCRQSGESLHIAESFC